VFHNSAALGTGIGRAFVAIVAGVVVDAYAVAVLQILIRRGAIARVGPAHAASRKPAAGGTGHVCSPAGAAGCTVRFVRITFIDP